MINSLYQSFFSRLSQANIQSGFGVWPPLIIGWEMSFDMDGVNDKVKQSQIRWREIYHGNCARFWVTSFCNGKLPLKFTNLSFHQTYSLDPPLSVFGVSLFSNAVLCYILRLSWHPVLNVDVLGCGYYFHVCPAGMFLWSLRVTVLQQNQTTIPTQWGYCRLVNYDCAVSLYCVCVCILLCTCDRQISLKFHEVGGKHTTKHSMSSMYIVIWKKWL